MARVFGEKIEKFGGVSKKTCHRQWLLNSRSPPVVHCSVIVKKMSNNRMTWIVIGKKSWSRAKGNDPCKSI